jgi:phosphoenolpyruvate carboxykinase (GTP)
MPKIFYVNWFRQDENGKFLWPGYGENSRVLEWVFERCDNRTGAVDTPIGRVPAPKDIDTRNLAITEATLAKLLSVDIDGWLAEIPLIRQHFEKFGDRLPKGLTEEVDKLEERLKRAK